mgnify:CR=1 FL=1
MKNANREIGTKGEECASQYLQDLGYQILDRNWRTKRGELDIVAMRESTLVFCEVKTRTSKVCGLPSESVSKTKIQHLKTVALEWLNSNQVNRSGIRFDVIAVLIEPTTAPQISHIQGIEL